MPDCQLNKPERKAELHQVGISDTFLGCVRDRRYGEVFQPCGDVIHRDTEPVAGCRSPDNGENTEVEEHLHGERSGLLLCFCFADSDKRQDHEDAAVACVPENHRKEDTEKEQEPQRNIGFAVAGHRTEKVRQRGKQLHKPVMPHCGRNGIFFSRII